jgi:tagatose-6-phosphate ketose/aldose isomerase
MNASAARDPDLDAAGAGWTIREIRQQPEVWPQAAADATARRDEVAEFLRPVLAAPTARIVLTGAGSSAFAGGILAPVLARRLGRRVDAVATTDIVSNPREAFAEDVPTVVVSLARSGDSPESIAATELADQSLSTVRHLVVTCNPAGRLAREHTDSPTSLVLLTPEPTNDRGFAMTSSFTSMVLAGWLALDPTAAEATDVAGLAAAAQDVLDRAPEEMGRLASAGYQRVVYLGSGCLTALARESALKLLELTAGRVVSYFDSPLGFRHGPKAVLHPGTLAVVFVSNDPYTRRYDEDIVAELRTALGAEHVVVLTGRADPSEDVGGRRWVLPNLEKEEDAALALPFLVVAQLLALQMSLALGCTPDNPFPTGDVNRVVKGVTVYPLDGS